MSLFISKIQELYVNVLLMLFRCLSKYFYWKIFCFVLYMGNVKIDSNMKLLIILKTPSKFGLSSLRVVTGRKHTREQTRRNLKSSTVSFSNILSNSKFYLCVRARSQESRQVHVPNFGGWQGRRTSHVPPSLLPPWFSKQN